MILSVSRRTDIPAFYAEWFINRIKEGFVYVRNPFNAKQISNVYIGSEVVDCIVFWTKNARPIIKRLDELDARGYKYYFQFTINPYGSDLERNIGKKEQIIETFQDLSQRIGREKVIWRYDPIILSGIYDYDFHFEKFTELAGKLKGFTNKVVISYLDDYRKISRNMRGLGIKEITEQDMLDIAKRFSSIAKDNDLTIETCAEAVDLGALGINHGKCIDGDLIERIIGYDIRNKDKRDDNRKECGCMKCIDIGQYDSCVHNCLYCYANINKHLAYKNKASHNTQSPILFGTYDEANVKSRKDKDIRSFRIDRGLFD